MIKKISALLGLILVLGFGFIFGFTLVSARVIPGWDKPWDPPNYYSLTSISWADTNNPSFFYRDLGWQGGEVYDPTREAKQILHEGYLLKTLDILQQKLGISILNSTPLPQNKLEEHRANIEQIQNAAIDSNLADKTMNVLNGTLFRSSDNYNGTYDTTKQTKELGNIYRGFAGEAQKFVETRQQTTEALNSIANSAATAQGIEQVQQANNDLEALYQAEMSRRNALLANITALQAVQQKVETDAAIARKRVLQDSKMKFVDPYNPSEKEEKLYSRPEGKGFVEFKMDGE